MFHQLLHVFFIFGCYNACLLLLSLCRLAKMCGNIAILVKALWYWYLTRKCRDSDIFKVLWNIWCSCKFAVKSHGRKRLHVIWYCIKLLKFVLFVYFLFCDKPLLTKMHCCKLWLACHIFKNVHFNIEVLAGCLLVAKTSALFIKMYCCDWHAIYF